MMARGIQGMPSKSRDTVKLMTSHGRRLMGGKMMECCASNWERATRAESQIQKLQLIITGLQNELIDLRRRCPCGGIVLADTEDWDTPRCDGCYTKMGEPSP